MTMILPLPLPLPLPRSSHNKFYYYPSRKIKKQKNNLRLLKLQFQQLLHPSKTRKWPTAALQIQTGSLYVPIAFFDSLRYCSFLMFFEDLSNNFSSHNASLDLDFFQAIVSKPAKLSCSILPKWRCMLAAQVSGISLTCLRSRLAGMSGSDSAYLMPVVGREKKED